MQLHLVKLAVGVEDVKHLQELQLKRVQQYKAIGLAKPELFHVTRNTPRRVDELLNGGSLYWVIRRTIQVRQFIVRFEKMERSDGKKSCVIILDKNLKKTIPQKARPFQGWRYLTSMDAPNDISNGEENELELPLQLLQELKTLGLI